MKNSICQSPTSMLSETEWNPIIVGPEVFNYPASIFILYTYILYREIYILRNC